MGVDSITFPSLNKIQLQESKPTTKIQESASTLIDYLNHSFLDYAMFSAVNIQLRFDIDATYLVLPEARRQVSFYFY